MRTRCVVVLMACVFAIPGFAQDSKLDLFGGASLLRSNPSPFIPGVNMGGWEASATYNWSKLLGITADVDGHYCCDGAHMYNFLAGPQLRLGHGRLSPFVHGLAGVSHGTQFDFDHTVFAYAAGGGLDIKATDHVAVRIGQFDYLATRFATETQHNFRYSVGLVFRLGNK